MGRSRASRAPRAALATIALAALALTSCITTPGPSTPTTSVISTSRTSSTTTSTTSTTPTEVYPVGLEKYYTQTLDWSGCDAGAQCAQLEVPIDYAKPDGATLQLWILRQRATGSRIGSLIVNPGGPGASGADYAKGADRIVGQPVRRGFDIVGFDPRGVGKSAPLKCLEPGQMDAMLAADPTPDTPSEEQTLFDWSTTLGTGCATGNGQLASHVSTVEVAKDMDILRAVLGDPKVNYLGKSYGTAIGAQYAELFPTKVGRMVLDGVVAPELTNEQVSLGQAIGFERATTAYVTDCVSKGGCILGDTVEEGMAWIRDFLKKLDSDPLPTTDPSAPQLTEGWAVLGIALPMYDSDAWPMLTAALKQAQGGDGSMLMRYADMYADRTPGGGYDGNMMQAISAVNCLDRPDTGTPASIAAKVPGFEAKAPTWGTMMAWSLATCAAWPIKSPYKPHKIAAPGTDTIVVVGTTNDPATPYEWAQMLRTELANATLITWKGDGHTAYMRSNSCVEDAINNYYVGDTAPLDGLEC